MQSLNHEQKPNWPVYLPALIFSYNATPHSTTGCNFMSSCLGTRPPHPVTIGLGLGTTNQEVLILKPLGWGNNQMCQLVSANKHALKLINKTTQCSKSCIGGKELLIPVGDHILLHDHPEGHNKIQDGYKSHVYVVVGHHQESNVYYIQLLNPDCKSKPKVVNCHQIYDLNHSQSPSESQGSEPGDNGNSAIPSFFAGKFSGSHNSLIFDPHSTHHYNTWSKLKATTVSRQTVVDTQVTHL